jgi:alkylresorcinol/alkylpyrone synthase
MGKIIGVETAFPKYRYPQKEISGLLKKLWPDHAEVIDRLATTSGVDYRHLAQPLENFLTMGGFESRQKVYLSASQELLKEAMTRLHETENFPWEDVGAIFSTTITGIAVPSLEARMMNHFPKLPRNLTRMPIFGLGCLGGIGTLNRASDWLRQHPTKLALVMAVEICSLTFQLKDITMANLIATHLFGDGAAVVLMAGDKHPLAARKGLRVLSHYASFYPDTERVMGWEMVNDGFQIILSGNVPDMVTKHVAEDLKVFLPSGGPGLDDLRFVISHPGGPKVLKAVEQILGKTSAFTKHSWESLRDNGNMSSVSVLDVLSRTLKNSERVSGLGLGLAMGPAFNAELTLFEAT